MVKEKGKRGQVVTISGRKYFFRVDSGYERKFPRDSDYLGVQLGVSVFRLPDYERVPWEEIKGTYAAEKIIDFIENAANGQETFYWDSTLGKEKTP